MFPVAWPIVVIFAMVHAVAGMGIGAIIGWLVSQRTKSGRYGVLKDALLGCLGYVTGFVLCVLMPWPENTVVEQLDGGGSVATTMSSYQHPFRVAVAFAVLFPLLREIYLWKKRRDVSLT
jgi:hypothetical protein